MEQTIALKDKWNEVVLKIQHKGGGITFDKNYEKINRILLTPFYENRAIEPWYIDLIEWIIEQKEIELDSL